jgi:predicted metalloprotease
VQNLLGVMQQANERMQGASREEANRVLVRLELQADFLAGVWANHAQRMKNFLQEGDIEEGLNAASSVGDDRIMKQQQGYVVPDAFTHGTSAQRVRWFTLGLKTGDLNQGDTFAAREL